MKLPAFLRRAPKKPARPLSAALDNPYRPVFGRERRFEELVRGKAKPEKQP
ncbi:MAG TPA: hypothetical protein H9795_00040 [Candidatus Fournierella merdigallinarum]|nr:hypothetical protein [Candidatus Fournierella merdigallinarum]